MYSSHIITFRLNILNVLYLFITIKMKYIFQIPILILTLWASGLYIECKSWGGNQPGMGNVPAQMINYFNTQTSLDNFQFQFDPDRWVPTDTDLNTALKANANLFNTTDQVVWDRMVTMLGGDISIITKGKTDDLINLITNSTNFSRIINP